MSSVTKLPPALREGDRISREEFLWRWEAEPDLKRAELIDGTVHMPSPVSRLHSRFTRMLIGWISIYSAGTPGTDCGNDSTWLMLQSAPQPDVDLCLLPEYGGNSREAGAYISGAPELAVEVCASSASYDLGPKLDLYRRAGVREYLTVLLAEQQVIWRSFDSPDTETIAPNDAGILCSAVFPGLWLDGEALLRGDQTAVFAVAQQGLASAEHAAFLQRLSGR